ncbi:hypothetical protein FXO38_15441 [Capsicum annuum]|uniref:Uncharacterized protein n=1 Tax=Capsicum annuum TaxID=4072 RepID=A0A2G3AN70_CAPAN|nr:hypothetical protein FXO38_15441 [Capsicum annuum]KAF3655787.1 hypothetical protein FXO37_15761 [Capsicum annuum]PHT95681.1 hypothetical protein T459_03563 [Capsicum annuum]
MISLNVSASNAQVVVGSYPNVWGLKKEVATTLESISAPWSALDVESKLAHASALEKIISGRSTTINNNVYNMLDVVGGPEYIDKANGRKTYANVTGFQRLHNVVSSSGYEM